MSGGGPLSVGGIVGFFVGWGVFVLVHGVSNISSCTGACWAGGMAWAGIFAAIGGYVGYLYDQRHP